MKNVKSIKKFDSNSIAQFVNSTVGEDLHAKQALSLSNAVTGLMHAAALGIHAIGKALAKHCFLKPKHAIKQVDRLLSNEKISAWNLAESYVPYVVANRSEILVALDWTDFDKDDQITLVLSLVSSHGRATPLLWKTYKKSELAGNQEQWQQDLCKRFHEVMPENIKVTIIADRGFQDNDFCDFLKNLGFEYIIRIRKNILIEYNGERKHARDWLFKNGSARLLSPARITLQSYEVPAVVCTKKAGMKEAWFLITSHSNKKASEIVSMYARRFTIEESFRDSKNLRFGMGLSDTRIKSPKRRDTLLFLFALSTILLTLLGSAGEASGYSRWLKANTSKKRAYSLLNQGLYYFEALPNMKPFDARPILLEFNRLLEQMPLFRQLCEVI
mgnify:CR=1 FL=1